MKEVIGVKKLNKTFKAKLKEPGVKGSLKSLFKPEYRKICAVNDISFSIKQGEIVGFIGPNGAGKSTTIKMMTGILHPTSGEMNILGFNPQKERKKLAFEIGTVFGQKQQLWYHLPAIDSFNLFAKIYEIPEQIYEKRLKKLVKMFAVEDIIKQPVRKLSLGQRMRCELIASLLHKPKVLFLDEPTIGLDIVVKKKMRELIKYLNKKEKLTIVLTSHDMDDVEQICDRLLVINHGTIIYDGSMDEVKAKYLTTKTIHVTFSEKVRSLKLKGMLVDKKDEFSYELTLATDKISVKQAVEYLVENYAIEDIAILDPPIEEMIEQIFEEGR